MLTWKVWFNDCHTGKNHTVKVNAPGIVPAIEEAQKAMMDKVGLKYLDWTLWKIEMV